MYIGNYCPGCGGEGNQFCKIAKCILEQGKIECCYRCGEYPCEIYDHIDDSDYFITHRKRKADLEKAKKRY